MVGDIFVYGCLTLDFKINFRGGKAMKKAIANVVSLMFLASSAFASEELLKCKWVATGEVEGRLRLI